MFTVYTVCILYKLFLSSLVLAMAGETTPPQSSSQLKLKILILMRLNNINATFGKKNISPRGPY